MKDGSSRLRIDGTNLLKIYYKFQDSDQSTYSSTIFNTVWIDANDALSDSPQANVDNFYLTSNTLLAGSDNTSGGIQITSGGGTSVSTVTFNVFIPSISTINDSTYVYCRVGLPMTVDVGFTYISSTIN